MGIKYLELKMPTKFSHGELREKIKKKLHLKEFSFQIDKQSLDARNKRHIHWKLKLVVSSPSIKGSNRDPQKKLEIPYQRRDFNVIVVGSGPAGFFAADVLQSAGFNVTLLEQGPEVNIRFKDIKSFERNEKLIVRSNYAFGEGGAGTFSDGKLTARTKTISLEKKYVFDTYIDAGAPKEISYMQYPHLGSDHLRKIVKNLRTNFIRKGGHFFFDTKVENILLDKKKQKIFSVETDKGVLEAQEYIFAMGHSSYETYRMLIRKGIPFRVKGFAIGSRVEHLQELINQAQWGQTELPGIKSAQYRLTYKPKEDNELPVYSFCMCPGGKVVPSTAYKNRNIVNGMSNYRRNSLFANSAVVGGLNINQLLGKEVDPLEALDWLDALEKKFYDYSNGYIVPAVMINDFLSGKISNTFPISSFPFGLLSADFGDLFPKIILNSLKNAIKDFCRKIKGFEEGVLMGLESKTSSILQAIRHHSTKSVAVDNLYIVGEGSGCAGGIVSSAADGIKAALDILKHH